MSHARAAGPGAPRVRPEAYHLLSRLYLGGLVGPEQSSLWEAPEFRHLAARVETDSSEVERRFPADVPLLASAFLEVDGTAGRDVSAALARRFGSADLESPVHEPPDHLGNELALLAILSERASASAATEADGVGADEGLGFLDGHLLWWLPSLVAAVGRHGTPFWREVAEHTLRLTVDHRRSLVGGRAPSVQPPWNLMGLPPDPLDDPTVGLREISIFLVHPVRSGLYLSDADARALGDTGGRGSTDGAASPARTLETVFHFSAAYHRLDDVVAGLRGVLADVMGFMEEAVAHRGLHSGFVTPWQRRLDQTDAMLVRIARGEGPVA